MRVDMMWPDENWDTTEAALCSVESGALTGLYAWNTLRSSAA